MMNEEQTQTGTYYLLKCSDGVVLVNRVSMIGCMDNAPLNLGRIDLDAGTLEIIDAAVPKCEAGRKLLANQWTAQNVVGFSGYDIPAPAAPAS